MRSIEISTEAFALIWAARQAGEETEDQILIRLLNSKSHSSVAPLSQAAPALPDSSRRRSKVLWRDDIIDGLNRLGGKADLHEIYRVVKEIRRVAGRSLPPSAEAVIRRELENNSSDSESYTGQRNLFRSVNGLGAGRWALR